MINQAISRICHGCNDRYAGQYVVNLHLTSLEDVIDKIKSYQFNHAAIYVPKASTKPQVREVALNSSDTESETDFDTETFQSNKLGLRRGLPLNPKQILPELRVDLDSDQGRNR